jgi:tRNA modification GTPase
MDDATIAAIASPAGMGGISIVKISGRDAIRIASAIFAPGRSGPQSRHEIITFKSNKLYYGRVLDPLRCRVIDEVLLSVMKAPRSYTREDVVEINAHGGPVAVREILNIILQQGARLAEPGEFTLRAFLNGRIDLTQAEAVMDVIHARASRGLEMAAAQLAGALRAEIEGIRSNCLGLLSRVEAGIDFPEEVEETIEGPAMGSEFRQGVLDPIKRLIRNYADGSIIRQGLTVAIVGRPNVGKSSLMNRLLARERAIVTCHPGTTRDVIEDHLVISGLAVSLLDTAGLHASMDPLESLGMQKTIEHCSGADLVLLVLEADQALSDADKTIFERVRLKPVIAVLNKIDLLNGSEPALRLPEDWAPECRVRVSALSGQGIDALREQIVLTAAGGKISGEAADVMPNLRQKAILERCLGPAEEAEIEFANGARPELLAVNLTAILNALDEVAGRNAKADVLDGIFSRFCIGK